MPKIRRKAFVVLTIALTIVTGSALGQSESEPTTPLMREAPGEFQFARFAYSSNQYGGGRGWGRRRQMWQTDWPDADHHFSRGVERLTRIEVAERGHIVLPMDDEIYEVEVGHWYLNAAEAAHLREYLLRGGFLMVDDFHGTWEWASFVASMEKIFPDRPIVDIPEDDEAFHVHYDLDHLIQIPSRMYIYSGVTWEKGGYTPRWRGIYDDDGRLMVAINFNMDIGDAWEHADWPDYPENMTALAYRFGINYLIYAMTH